MNKLLCCLLVLGFYTITNAEIEEFDDKFNNEVVIPLQRAQDSGHKIKIPGGQTWLCGLLYTPGGELKAEYLKGVDEAARQAENLLKKIGKPDFENSVDAFVKNLEALEEKAEQFVHLKSNQQLGGSAEEQKNCLFKVQDINDEVNQAKISAKLLKSGPALYKKWLKN